MKKWILLLTLMGSATNAGEYWLLKCNGYGQENTLEISGSIEEAGGTYLDAFMDITLKEQGTIVFEKKRVDTTGYFQIEYLDGQQVYLAEVRPMNRSIFTTFRFAANHPRPSGNSVLVWNGKEYLAECTVR